MSAAEKLRDVAFRMRTCAMCNHAQEVEAIAATLGSEQPPVDKLIRCLENDYGITASWDGLRKVWLTERATLGRGTCRMEQIPECQYDDIACSECGVALWAFSMDKEGEGVLATPNYCPYCGAKVVES